MSLSLYTIIPTNDNKFEFIALSGRKYTIYFDRSANIFPDERVDRYAVYFGFNCDPPLEVLNRVHDARIGYTIMHIIANYFYSNPDDLLVYVCSALNGQDRHRQISFAKWYHASPLKNDFVFLQKKFFDTYCGVIYDAAHPELSIIEDAFLYFDLDDNTIEEDAEEYLQEYEYEL